MAPILPEPCAECAPYGGTHRWYEEVPALPGRKRRAAGLDRCTCRRGAELSRRDAVRPKTVRTERGYERQVPEGKTVWAPQISKAAAAKAAAMLAENVPYYPHEPAARTAVANEFRRLCNGPAELGWLVRRVMLLWHTWHGLRELRVLFCSRFQPVDGVDLSDQASEAYPDGIPEEYPVPLLDSADGTPAQLAAWEQEAGPADPGASQRLLTEAARVYRMPKGQTRVVPSADLDPLQKYSDCDPNRGAA